MPDVGEPHTLPGPMSVGEFLEAIHLATNWNIIVFRTGKRYSDMSFWLVEKNAEGSIRSLKVS